jgi:hypothetical protein
VACCSNSCLRIDCWSFCNCNWAWVPYK